MIALLAAQCMPAVSAPSGHAHCEVANVRPDVVGGPGEAVARTLVNAGVSPGFRHIGLPEKFPDAGALPTLHDRSRTSVDAACSQFKRWA